ncbi:MAG: DNA mismatch repair protein MutS [Clostridia bacterium]|nr:DNA mismatch repair protein MutS [Clostridia bacterium]
MASLTPMMRQYLEMKEKYNDCLLFFRLGDFYEMFFDDTVTASRELELTLTGRDCGLPERAPMCGVPYHSVNTYITRLIQKGYKVAICEQLTDPALSNGLVERDVIRVITPGTVIEEQMLDERQNNYIAAVCAQGKSGSTEYSLAYCDVSTGEFYVMSVSGANSSNELFNELTRISPRELIIHENVLADELLAKRIKSKFYIEQQDQRAFDIARGQQRLLAHFGVATLSGFGIKDNSFDVSSPGALLRYLEETQKNALSHIRRMIRLVGSEYMSLDASTRLNLELTDPIRFDGNRKFTLLNVLDKTKTAMGGRLLRRWIEQPLQNEAAINERLDSVEAMHFAAAEREVLSDLLSKIYDIERLSSRIAYGTVTPRDCIALSNTLAVLPDLLMITLCFKKQRTAYIADNLDLMDDILKLLTAAISPDAPASAKDGGVIRSGYNKQIDELRDLAENGEKWIRGFEAAEKERTGIKTLKVGYNRVFGYYIEVSKSFVGGVPLEYQRKQTLANAERYVTPQLKDTEEKLLGAKEHCLQLEAKLFTEIKEKLLACLDRLKKDSELISELDALCSLAKVACANNYSRPKINTSGRISIKDGRHPVVELSMKDEFIPNSTEMNMNADRLIILTGPNMAGKSTYMRQVALITLMAHIGSFVPASSANIAITDRIFTRVGASDSLSTGQSTFMVEMSEMANILNNATKRSLLILDEIGRGTSTFDGLSIAWAVLEHISDTFKCGAKALFATHYHELTELEGKLDGVKNYRISVKEIGDSIIFLRKIVRGGADKSFGIQVAKLAGLPDQLIERAKSILSELEESDVAKAASRVGPEKTDEQVSLLAPVNGAEQGDSESSIVFDLSRMDVERMTPMEALAKLYEISTRAKLIK